MNLEKLKRNWYLILIALATVILGIIAVVTAIKLFQIGKKPVAPTAPQPAPAAAPACTLEFTISALPTPTPTLPPACVSPVTITMVSVNATSTRITASSDNGYTDVEIRVETADSTVTPYQSPTITGSYNWIWTVPKALSEIMEVSFYVGVTGLGQGGVACGTWVPSPTPTPTPTVTVTPTPTGTITLTPTPTTSPGPTPTPITGCYFQCSTDGDCLSGLHCQDISGTKRCVNINCSSETDCACNRSCWEVCGTDYECPSGLSCHQIDALKRCVNPTCEREQDCNCAGITQTPTPPVTTPRLTTTPTTYKAAVEVPESGFTLPTVGAILGGIILVVSSLLLIL